MKKIFLFLGIGLIILFINSFFNFKYTGIDLSHHNDISLSELKEINPDFVYIKVSDGNKFKDPERYQHLQNVKQVTNNIGVYHYFRDGINADEQFQNYKQSIKDFDYNLIPVIDYERPFTQSKNVRIKNLKQLYKLFENEYGQVMIYCQIDTYFELRQQFPKAKFWISYINLEDILQIKQSFHNKELDFNYSNDIYKF